MIKRQVIALGGGGFSMEPENPLLDNYILKQSLAKMPKICFLATASGDSQNYIQRFYNCYDNKKCIPSHLALFNAHTHKIEEFILEQDIIFVGGGNTRNMLILWQAWGLDKILTKAYQKGIILSGISAGSICWFEQGLTDSIPNQLSSLDGLGLLKGSNCPHFDGEAERQDAYKEKIKNNIMKSGIACDDGVALHYINEKLERIVASSKGKFAYKIYNSPRLTVDTIQSEYLENI